MPSRRATLSISLAASVVALSVGPSAIAQAPPTTEFEDSGRTTFTSHEAELEYLEALDAFTPRLEVDVIGESVQGRPIHLVRIGHPTPRSLEDLGDVPVQMHFCSQHGNEEAGRDGCLIAMRDIALSEDPAVLEQLANQATIFIPAANPDGSVAVTRANANGVDLNRQHLQVDQPEVRIIGRVLRDWKPDIALDHHEYGSTPVVYDDDITILWPRNKNVHRPLRDLSVEYVVDFMKPCTAEDGYTMDEYGISSVSVPGALDIDLTQTAGDWDDGISRNVGGLRHSMGILIESQSTTNSADVRVGTHESTIHCTLEWMRSNGERAHATTKESRAAKVQEGLERSEPTWFDGQDEDTTADGLLVGSRTESTSFQDPPFCGFTLTADQLDADTLEALDVHGIVHAELPDGGAFVSMAQEAEPVIGLLLDERGKRHLVAATGLDDCSPFAASAPAEPAPEPAPAPQPGPAPEPAPSGPLPVTGGGLAIAALGIAAGAATMRRR